jgi:hypothetical protein
VAAALSRLHGQIESGTREGVKTLLLAQTSVRLLERLLTLRVVGSQFTAARRSDEAAMASANAGVIEDDDNGEGKAI